MERGIPGVTSFGGQAALGAETIERSLTATALQDVVLTAVANR